FSKTVETLCLLARRLQQCSTQLKQRLAAFDPVGRTRDSRGGAHKSGQQAGTPFSKLLVLRTIGTWAAPKRFCLQTSHAKLDTINFKLHTSNFELVQTHEN